MPERLSTEELFEVTYFLMPDELGVDENRCLALEPEEEQGLARFLKVFGFQLPAEAPVDATLALWRDLQLNYSQAARLAAEGRDAEIPRLCPSLNGQQTAYCVAVGRQERDRASQMAKQLFFGRDRLPFISA